MDSIKKIIHPNIVQEYNLGLLRKLEEADQNIVQKTQNQYGIEKGKRTQIEQGECFLHKVHTILIICTRSCHITLLTGTTEKTQIWKFSYSLFPFITFLKLKHQNHHPQTLSSWNTSISTPLSSITILFFFFVFLTSNPRARWRTRKKSWRIWLTYRRDLSACEDCHRCRYSGSC